MNAVDSKNMIRIKAYTVAAACAWMVACSGNDSNLAPNTGTAGTGGTTGAGGTAGTGAGGAGGSACTTDMQILFTPVYSAYDGVNTYKVPVIAVGITGDIKWTASDNSFVDIDPDAVQFSDSANITGKAAMLTTRKAGTVTISATSGSACGSTELTITQATSELRKTGSDRYNNGVPITFDGGRTPSCTNCHGTSATNQLVDVEHTPQQTGGYSDEDLLNIFTKGQKPAGVGCRVVPCSTWTSFHQWDATPDEAQGIVFYLRSIEPAPQGGITIRPPGRPGDAGPSGG